MLTKELRAFTLMINLDMVEEKILEFRSFKTNFFFYFLYRIINYFVSVHYNSHISLYAVANIGSPKLNAKLNEYEKTMEANIRDIYCARQPKEE